MLIKYVYAGVPRLTKKMGSSQVEMNKMPVAVVVATQDGVGMAVCHSKKMFNKKVMKEIAFDRSKLRPNNEQLMYVVPDREIISFYSDELVKLGDEVQFQLVRMRERAAKYYKHKEEEVLVGDCG